MRVLLVSFTFALFIDFIVMNVNPLELCLPIAETVSNIFSKYLVELAFFANKR